MRRGGIINLRVVWANSPPAIGSWIASANSDIAFRVLATEESRVTCARYNRSVIPAGARVHSWGDITKPRAQPVRPRRRSDPLLSLLKRGAITERQFVAALRFRDTVDRSLPQLPVARMIRLNGPMPDGPDDRHLQARKAAARAISAVGLEHVPILDWCVVGNGSVSGFASHMHTRPTTASDCLRAALQRLELHYNPPVTGPRR